jgi:mRNA interferase RelE/StbE
VAYTITILPAALKALLEVPKKDREKIRTKIDSLAENPRPPGVKRLKGDEGYHRVRSGDYRVLYLIVETKLLVVVVKIGNRRDVYR